MDDIGAATENGNTSVDVVINDSDVDNANSTLVIGRANVRSGPSVTASSGASTGVSIAADGRSIVFKADDYTNPSTNVKGFDYLAEGQTATVLIDYNVVDPQGASSNSTTPPYSTLTITVTGTNDAPVITSGVQTGAVKEDMTLTATGTVTSTDVDDGHTATYSGSTTGTYGSFAVDGATGVWTYTLTNGAANVQALAAGESHNEIFTVTVTDDKGATAPQNVTVKVTGTNDDPVITSDPQTGAVKEDTTLTATGTVTSTDVDNGHTAAYTGNATGTYGGFAIDVATGVWTYTLNNGADNVQALAAGESHNETFTVTVTDDKGATATQNVIVKVTGTNDNPVVASATNSVTTNEDTASSSVAIGASDVDGDTLSFSAAGATKGTVSFAGGGFIYTPNANANGSDAFTITVADGHGGTTTQAVSVTINPVTDLTAVNDTASTNEDNAVTASVATNDSTTSGGALTFAKGLDPSHGTVSVTSAGAYTYTPAANYNGPDSFTYTVTDAAANESATRTVSITVNPVNDAPVAVNDSYTTAEDTAVTIPTPGVLINDTDVDSNSLSAVLVASPLHGSLVFNTNGSFTYTPTANYNGTDSFTYKANDGTATGNTATVNLTITPVADASVIGGLATGTVTEDLGSSIASGTLTVTDPDGPASFVANSVTGVYGSFSLDTTGAWTYNLHNADLDTNALNTGEVKHDLFTVTSNDGTTSQVDVTVNGHSDQVAANIVFVPNANEFEGGTAGSNVDVSGVVGKFVAYDNLGALLIPRCGEDDSGWGFPRR